MISPNTGAHSPPAWRVRSLRSGVVGAVAVALAFPPSAFAHANLESTTPKFQQRLIAAPYSVTLRFDQPVQAEPNAIEVKNAFGRRLSAAARADERTVTVPLGRLARGAYTVRWHVLSEDGHVVSGVFTFGVRVKAPPPTEAFGASAPPAPSTSSAGPTSSRSRSCSAGSPSGSWSPPRNYRRPPSAASSS